MRVFDRLKKKIKKFVRSCYQLRITPPDRPDLVDDLRKAFAALPALPDRGSSGPEDAWFNNLRRLREHVQTGDPKEFLRWDVIKATMFVRDSSYIPQELAFLRAQPDWHSRWRGAVRESSVGRPQLSWHYPHSSGNLLHHAYHLARFETATGAKVTNAITVLEFGGGYGSTCRLFHNLGFRGRYIIFDLPDFALLQTYYLRAQGLQVLPLDAFRKAPSGIVCLSALAELIDLVGKHVDAHTAMFVATWSLSETPLELRPRITPLLTDFSAILIAYQRSFENVDNEAFFLSFIAEIGTRGVSRVEIDHLPGNYYIFKAPSA